MFQVKQESPFPRLAERWAAAEIPDPETFDLTRGALAAARPADLAELRPLVEVDRATAGRTRAGRGAQRGRRPARRGPPARLHGAAGAGRRRRLAEAAAPAGPRGRLHARRGAPLARGDGPAHRGPPRPRAGALRAHRGRPGAAHPRHRARRARAGGRRAGREGRHPLRELPRGGAVRPRLPHQRHRRLPAPRQRGGGAGGLHAEALRRPRAARLGRGADREGAAVAVRPARSCARWWSSRPPRRSATGCSPSTRWSARGRTSTTTRGPPGPRRRARATWRR